MNVESLGIPGAFLVTPVQHVDHRGRFLEWYRSDRLSAVIGHRFDLAQANVSVSARGTVRGIHYPATPPGQAKYVTCVRGALLDYIVDIRVGSPTFGQHRMVRLDDVKRQAVYIAEGLGHAVCALEDDATLLYVCSRVYDPIAEREISPIDPEIGLKFPWSQENLLISAKDRLAPTLAKAHTLSMLPNYQECAQWYVSLKSKGD